jgi:hypothetical protein
MAHLEIPNLEGTPEQLATVLGQLSSKRRYRIVEVEEPPTEESDASLPDPKAVASIALLKSWIAQAPTDPEEIREAEKELREFKRNMNANRAATGERIPYPDAAE